MNARRLVLRGSRLVLLLGSAIALSATPAANAGRAEIGSVDTTFPVDEVVPADCFDGTMHATGTERIAGRVVELGDNNFRFHGTITDAIDIAFSNGWTGVWTTNEHFSFSVRGGDQAYTNVHRDTTAVYDNTGQFIGTVSFRVVEHVTVAGGIVRVDFAHPQLTCHL